LPIINLSNPVPITIGEIILPRSTTNLNQILFKGVKIFEFNNPKIKKIIEITNDQILKSPPLKNGYVEIIQKLNQ